MANNKQKPKQSTIKDNSLINNEVSTETNVFYLLPILFIVAFLPLIMRLHIYNANLSTYTFFANNDEYADFFLYYKQMTFIFVAGFMLLFGLYYSIKNRKTIHPLRLYFPLAVYALFVFLSSILSKYKYYSFHGMFEQFESVYAVLGYCIVAYYVFLFVKSERDIRYILIALFVGSLLISVIGVPQMFGHNFFSTPTGWRFITKRAYWDLYNTFQFNFANIIYSTLYNPNYVGVYASLVLPTLIISSFVTKKSFLKIGFILSSIGVIICLIGSHSSTGIVSLIFGFIFSAVLFRRYLVKYYKFSILFGVIIIASILVINIKYDNYFINQFNKIISLKKTTPALEEIQTTNNNIIIKYNGNTMQVDFYINEDGLYMFNVYDGDFMPINKHLEGLNGPVYIQDDRFPNFVLTPCTNVDGALSFSITIDNHPWYFSNQVLDKSYYIINEYGKYDKAIKAPSSLFTGYELYASGRGYLWSRTIPLLKDRIILGSGADTFTMVYPHQDYVNRFNFGLLEQLITKPHNLYLQIGVQTGVISLIAFLAFYLSYFIWSIKLYWKGNYKSYSSFIGVAILISTACYMVSGIANDSSISVAPLYWVFMGLGIAVNVIVKKEAQAQKQ